MSRIFLYEKDNLVLEISNYSCIIHDYEHLPVALRYEDVNYDDIMHGWLETRNMNVGRTNAKRLLAACNIPQSNSFQIAKMYHFASVTDCYWIREEGENISWKDVSLFDNEPSKLIVQTALFGKNHIIPAPSRIHTPEFSTQGMTAKAWVYNEGLQLFKVAKKEVAASQILSVLNIPHVEYSAASPEEYAEYVSESGLTKLKTEGEKVVKCPLITDENISIISWEDFAVYCECHDVNPYDVMAENFPTEYARMLVADYILGNEDRHEGNHGFFVDNASGKIIEPYPLMDHDHAFSNDELYTQTTERPVLMSEAVKESIAYLGNIGFEKVLQMEKPEELTMEEWSGVRKRVEYCRQIELTHSIMRTGQTKSYSTAKIDEILRQN